MSSRSETTVCPICGKSKCTGIHYLGDGPWIGSGNGGGSQPQSTIAERPWWFVDDDEANAIMSEAGKIADQNYVKNAGQAYYEDLLARATIAICRQRYVR